MQKTTTEEGLVRGIRRWDFVLLVLNSVIGAGIFGLPGSVFAIAGAWSLVAYLACSLVVALIVLCFAEVASRFRTTGGPYLYARRAFGPALGFQVGWLMWLARLTAFAALCNLWLDYLAFFWPGSATPAGRAALITAIVLVYTAVNIRGVRASTVVNDFFTLAKLGPLLLFIGIGAFFIEPANFSFAAVPSLGSFSEAVLLLVFAFSGFEAAVIPAGESKDPHRHAPFALMTGIGFIAVLYILIQVVSIGTLPGLGESSRPLADAATAFLGTPGGALISLGALISITGTLNVIVLVAPRLLFAMSEHRQLPRSLAATHPRYHTPYVAIALSAIVILVLTLQGSFVSSLRISTLIRLVTYAVVCAALPALRRRSEAGEVSAAFMAPAGVAASVAAIALCAWLIATSETADLVTTAVVAAIGFVLYFAFRGRGGTPSAEHEMAVATGGGDTRR